MNVRPLGHITSLALGCVCAGGLAAQAQPDPALPTPPIIEEPPPAPEPPEPAPEPPEAPVVVVEPQPQAEPEVAAPEFGGLQIHGFISEGAFVSTANDYIGRSSRGSVEMFEAGLNVSSQVRDRLRAGIQVFARDVGKFDDPLRIDWAYLDYRWRPWLGIRAGIIKMPLGLYNEYADIPAARLPILMPQSVYKLRNRDVFLSHRGFALYGNRLLGDAGELDYQVWLGTLDVPENALTLQGATLDGVDTKYITGGALTWTTPIEGLRFGATAFRASIDFDLTLAAGTTQALIAMGLVPPTFDGSVLVAQRPTWSVVGSVELERNNWLFAAEYALTHKRQVSDLFLIPKLEETGELFYAMGARRLSESFEVGAYYAVTHLDIDDRTGTNRMKFVRPQNAFQRDAAATLRYDVNEHWLWKVEAHAIDGAADVPPELTPEPKRYWWLFLLRTTVTF